MKILINDLMQFSDLPDELKSPSLASAYPNTGAMNVSFNMPADNYAVPSTLDGEPSKPLAIPEGLNGFNSIPEFIGQEYTNLVTDPTDLTTGNWIESNIDNVSDSGQTINGEILWSITSDGTDFAHIESSEIVANASIYTFSAVVKKGSADLTTILVRNNTQATSYDIRITFSTKTFSGNTTPIRYEWYDDDTVYIVGQTPLVDSSDAIEIHLYTKRNGTGLSTLFTQPQITEGTTMFPFVDGTHSADVIDETFTMQDKFAIDMIIEPKFAYDTPDHHWYVSWENGVDMYTLMYNKNNNQIWFEAYDGSTRPQLGSTAFDNGATRTINQRIRVVAFIDRNTTAATSSLMVIPLEQGAISEDTTWTTGGFDNTVVFNTLNIGHNSGGNQADSDIEYLRIYEWDGVKPTITNSDDVDTYFDTQTVSYEAASTLATENKMPVGDYIGILSQPAISGFSGVLSQPINVTGGDTFNCVGIGGTDATTFTINNTTVTSDDGRAFKSGVYELGEDITADTITIEHNGSYMGRIAVGNCMEICVSPTREPGFYTSIEARRTISGQVVPTAGGYGGQIIGVDFRYKIDEEIYTEFQKAYVTQIMAGFPFFMSFDPEFFPVEKFYADTDANMIFQSSLRRFKFSRRFEFKQAF